MQARGQDASTVCGGGRLRYRLTLVSGLVECICFAGVVFGWASLVFVLKTNDYFSNLCVNVTHPNSTIFTDCSAQDGRLSLVFTIASFMNNFLTFPNGFIFDQFGTTAARLLGIALYATGTLMVALSNAETSAILFPALSFIAVGGMLLLMTNIQVGNLFGGQRSTIITLYNGAFDSSSAVFLIVKVLTENGISLRTSFLFLSACMLMLLLRTFFLMPRTHIPYPLPEGYTYGMLCRPSRSYATKEATDIAVVKNGQDGGGDDIVALQPEETLSSSGRLQEDVPSFKSCFLSLFFFLHLVWLSVMQLRHYLFIGSLNPMLNRLTEGDPVLISKYTNAFAFTQLCGVLCAPWNGLIIDWYKRKQQASGQTDREADLRSAVISLLLTVLQCLLFSTCAAIPSLHLQYLTFALQVLNRSFLYGGNAAFISLAFPAQHFGKLFGLVMALSAVVSLLQYPCFMIIKDLLGGDPFYVNVALTLLTLLPFLHPLFIYRHCRQLASQRNSGTQ